MPRELTAFQKLEGEVAQLKERVGQHGQKLRKPRKAKKRFFPKKSPLRKSASLLKSFAGMLRSRPPPRPPQPQPDAFSLLALSRFSGGQLPPNTDQRGVMHAFQQEKTRQRIYDNLKNRRLSPSVKQQLLKIMLIQNKGKADDNRQQRILREKKLLEKSMSLLATPYIFKSHVVDMSGVTSDNILNSPNIMKENPEDHILRPSGRPSVLNTGENTLRF